ncbi:HAD family acid phosphatase [Streptomyces sp. KL118A]|uniref:HAD family acid phosphatase n=1 Tax=Streptomyces sp. KL118A TaxID=3045153 RepID=UPI00278BB157|nr:HAD family acid phosphatase [Streptomyces sp. KL118A]
MRKSLRVAGLATACTVAGAALYATGVASADQAGPRPTKEPHNIGLLVGEIDEYYGASQDADGVWKSSPDSPYAKDLARIQAKAKKDIKKAARKAHHGHGGHGGQGAHGEKPAIVLDVDDTALLSFDYEKSTNFTYNNDSWDAYVKAAKRPAVFGMPELVKYAKSQGVEVFFLTGLAESQREGAVTNLARAGYKTSLDRTHVFTKNKANPPAYLSHCATPDAWKCDTVQFKEGTRKHIESTGYDIVGSFGDQVSDLAGGYADKTYKLPNPTYFVG